MQFFLYNNMISESFENSFTAHVQKGPHRTSGQTSDFAIHLSNPDFL